MGEINERKRESTKRNEIFGVKFITLYDDDDDERVRKKWVIKRKYI